MDFVVQCTTNVQWIATMNLILFITSYNKTHMRIKSEEKQLSQLWKSAIKNNINRDHYAALKEYSKALEIAPKNHFLFYNRGLTYVDLQLLTQAKSDFDKAIFDSCNC